MTSTSMPRPAVPGRTTRRPRRGAAFVLALAALCAGGAGPAAAQTLSDYDYDYLAFRGIGFDVGRIWPSNLDATTAYRLRIDLGYLGPGVRIMPSITYWKTSIQADEIRTFESQLEARGASNVDLGEIDLSDVDFQVDAHFVWSTPVGLLTYLGAGIGLHALNGQGTVIDGTFIEDLFDSFMPGLALIGGLEYPLVDRLRLYGEARFNIVSDITYPSLSAGGAIMLPSHGAGGD